MGVHYKHASKLVDRTGFEFDSWSRRNNCILELHIEYVLDGITILNPGIMSTLMSGLHGDMNY
jgi:hypothetical protein